MNHTKKRPKSARANVNPVRQRTQFSCMAASMAMALRALGIHCTEDEAAEVMGVRPMRGATWEDALAAAQHFGCRATLCVPATLGQIKEWTDAGDPVMIAWNPEGREWSHASVIFDVGDDHTVHVADPNIPDPEETVRVVHRKDFYGKWSEKWPRYLVRRPAMRVSREITPEGRQVMAKTKQADVADRFRSMNTLRQHVNPKQLVKHLLLAMDDAQAESFFATMADLHHYPLTLGGHRIEMLEEALRHMDEDTVLDEMAREISDDLAESVLGEVANEHRILLGGGAVRDGLMSLDEFEQSLVAGPNPRISSEDFARLLEAKTAMFAEGEKVSLEEMADYLRKGGNPEAAEEWIKFHKQNKDKFTDKADKKAKFEKGKKMSPQDVADYLREHGNPEAADAWLEHYEKNKDKFTDKADKAASRQRLTQAHSARRQRLTERFPNGLPEVHKQARAKRITPDLLLKVFRDLETEDAKRLADAIKRAGNSRSVDQALKLADELLDGFGVEAIGSEEAWDNYYGDSVALYVNTGDTYNPTLVYGIEEGEFYLTDWGSWVEDYERQGGRIKAANWEEQPTTVEDWLTWEE